MSRPRSRTTQSIALVLGSVAVTLGLAEICLRAFFPVDYRAPAEIEDSDWRRLVHRPSSVPGLAYEPAPGVRATAHKRPVSTNTYGMRDHEPLEPADDVRYVALLGDSFTWGWAVAQDRIYPALVEECLNRRSGTYRWDALNFGVTGYGTRDELAVLEGKALQWDPDVVVVAYVLNDPEIDSPAPICVAFAEPRWWQQFHLLRLVARARRELDVRVYGDGDVIRYLHRYPPQWSSVPAAFEGMSSAARRYGFELLLVIFPLFPREGWPAYAYRDLHAQVAEAARRRGFRVLDLLATFEEYDPAKLRRGKRDGHPTARAYEIAAGPICRKILDLAPRPPRKGARVSP